MVGGLVCSLLGIYDFGGVVSLGLPDWFGVLVGCVGCFVGFHFRV